MATYKDIHGQNIPIRASDPSNPILGEVWYNSTTNLFKVRGFNTGGWTSGPNLNTATRAMFGGGTQTAAIKFAGANPGTNYSSNTEEYNGSSWSEVNNSPTAVDQANRGDVGLQTATFQAGGVSSSAVQAVTANYDGTNWTSSGALSNSRGDGAMWGVQNSAVLTGGYDAFSPPYWTNDTEEYNGTAWASGTATPLNTTNSVGVGLSESSGMIIGGRESPSNSYPGKTDQKRTLQYNGSAWTSLNDQLQTNTGTCAFGDLTAAVIAGASGGALPTTASEVWDGTSWSSGPTVSNAHGNGSGAGTGSDSGMAVGGYISSANVAAVTLWDKGAETQTISSS
tara:strand:- start:1901 stop:2917 length:1017 start_codon:yes stop_codon:yes gene_type:complete